VSAIDRRDWLAERRRAVEDDYDRDASTYDAGYDPVTAMHVRFVERVIASVAPAGLILDAPCGTGPYFGRILAAGRQVVGADQSRGMLAVAHGKYPDVRLEQVGLQELPFVDEFDAIVCIDAIEHVPPEDWPTVLGNLRRAVRAEGLVYLTIEAIDDAEHDVALAEAMRAGLPAVRGEHVGPDTGGYHFYPDRRQVEIWLDQAGLEVTDEADEALDGYGYRHLLLRRRPGTSG
jgi:SAM-dependent methyltransferase